MPQQTVCSPPQQLCTLALTGADIVPRLLGASLDRVHATIGSYFQILQYFTAVRVPTNIVSPYEVSAAAPPEVPMASLVSQPARRVPCSLPKLLPVVDAVSRRRTKLQRWVAPKPDHTFYPLPDPDLDPTA